VAGLKAAGGTAIDEALTKAMEERKDTKDGRLFLVVFMTDGQPTVGESNPDRILARMKDAEKGAQTRVFTFGVGSDVNTKLLDLLSEQSRGYAQYVLPNENLELSMSNFWGKVQDPIIASLKLDMGSIAVSKVSPKDMPDLFKGDQLVVFGTYAKAAKGAVTITGMVNGKEQKFSQDVTFEEKTDSSKDWIAKLWATRRVGYLLDEIRLHGESKEVKDEVVELARRWGVVTPYTAMLIIEDERRRGVPIAQRSLREMETDRTALSNIGGTFGSIRDTTGGQAVANAVNTSGYAKAANMQMANELAQQTQDRVKFDGNSALARGPDAVVIGGGAMGGMGGGFGGSGRGGRGGGGMASPSAAPAAASAPRAELNLGTQQTNGWQTNAVGKDAEGYRIVNNYAQQTRIVNNRSFFLNGNQWTDADVQNAKSDAKHVKIAFNSKEYFDLLTKYPDASQYLSLGNNLTLTLGGTIYDIVEEESTTK
jgi:Ca-activated chloride channel homolog